MRDLPVGKIPHTDARKRIQNAGTLRRVNPSEKADFVPQTHRRQFENRHRLAAVDVRLLWQIGDVFALQVLQEDASRIDLLQTHDRF